MLLKVFPGFPATVTHMHTRDSIRAFSTFISCFSRPQLAICRHLADEGVAFGPAGAWNCAKAAFGPTRAADVLSCLPAKKQNE